MSRVVQSVVRGIGASRVVLATIAACACGTSHSDSEIGSTENHTDPLPDVPDYVSNQADAVVFGRVVSSASFDVPTSETDVQTLSVVAIDSVERGNLRPGDEIVVITDDGKTEARYTDASHGAHPSVGLKGRFYLTSAAPDNLAFSNPAAMDAVELRSGYVFTVTGGTEGLQVPRSALATLPPCQDPDGVPGNYGFCTRPTTDWKPWNPNAVIKYWVNPDPKTTTLTSGQVVMAVQSGVAAWNDEPSAWARFEYQGTTTLTTDGTMNIFAFTSDCGGVGGETVRQYGSGNRLVHFTTCFNQTSSWDFASLMHTAMHESGHALGLGHIDDFNQVMRDEANGLLHIGWGDRNFLHVFYRGPEIPAQGDFNGDGAPDLVSFANQATSSSATVSVSLRNNTTNAFMTPTTWNSDFARQAETPLVGNFDGDSGHKDDIASFARQGTGDVKVCKSNGSSFSTCGSWSTGWLTHTLHPEVGDVNHDGKADIVAFSTDASGDVRVALSDGTKFLAPTVWHTFFGVGGEWPGVADVNQDGCADIVTMLNGAGSGNKKRVYVALSQACLATNPQNKFGTSVIWSQTFCGPNKTPSATSGGLSCVSLDGSAWTVAPVNAAKTGFDPEQQWGGTGGPVFNQTAFMYAYVYPYLVWFEHGSRAHAYARPAGGAPAQALNSMAPGPCPWNGVSGVCQ